MNIAIRYLLIFFVLILIIKITGCEPEDWNPTINCSDCRSYKPDSADLIINVTIDSQNDSVPLTFYKGKIEDNIVDWRDTATTEEFYLYSEVKQEYTVKATYKSGSETIIAVDSDRMKIYNAEEECGYPCYTIKGGIFNLRLLK